VEKAVLRIRELVAAVSPFLETAGKILRLGAQPRELATEKST
jgi:hypothetical protein